MGTYLMRGHPGAGKSTLFSTNKYRERWGRALREGTLVQRNRHCFQLINTVRDGDALDDIAPWCREIDIVIN